ncbi:hypothetical protein Hanom_Chr04g00335951 [Helianthus anomalus]
MLLKLGSFSFGTGSSEEVKDFGFGSRWVRVGSLKVVHFRFVFGSRFGFRVKHGQQKTTLVNSSGQLSGQTRSTQDPVKS